MTLTHSHSDEYNKKRKKRPPENWAEVPILHTFVSRARGLGDICAKIAFIAHTYADKCFIKKKVNKKIIEEINERNYRALSFLKETFYKLDPYAATELYEGIVTTRKKKKRKRRKKRGISWEEIQMRIKG